MMQPLYSATVRVMRGDRLVFMDEILTCTREHGETHAASLRLEYPDCIVTCEIAKLGDEARVYWGSFFGSSDDTTTTTSDTDN